MGNDRWPPYQTVDTAYEPGGMVYPPSKNNPGDPAPCAILSVSDVERLAKAGVKMDWETMRDQVRPDPVPDKTGMFDCRVLLRPLVARLRQQALSRSTKDRFLTGGSDGAYIDGPSFLSVVAHGEKVYVFVASGNQPPLILEDDLHLYPSDALIAKLHLMHKLHKEA